MTSLRVCLAEATQYWHGVAPSSADIQVIRAGVCVEILGGTRNAKALTIKDATKILLELNNRGLARKTVQDYYSAFKRMLALNDQLPVGFAKWPRAATPPRKTREGITSDDLGRMACWLAENNFSETFDLARCLAALGVRVQREFLEEGNLRVSFRDGHCIVLVTGKGGHQRQLPCVDREVQEILRDHKRMGGIRAVPYKTHLWRWNRGRRLLDIKGLATFHAIRHKYATEVLGRTRNLRLVQDLLGHSNPATTAIYAHVSMDDKVRALTE